MDEEVWQVLHPPGALREGPAEGPGGAAWGARLPDGRGVRLPVRVLPGDGTRAVASLLVNQAAFAVQDALDEALARALAPHRPDLVVGVPTLGLGPAAAAARRLGHARMLPLGTSRKFWYDEALSEPLRSITSPDHAKRLYLDPRLVPLLAGRRVAVVDDVISTGASMEAALRLLGRAGAAPVALGALMLQGEAWRALAGARPVVAAIRTPRLRRGPAGWAPDAEASA